MFSWELFSIDVSCVLAGMGFISCRLIWMLLWNHFRGVSLEGSIPRAVDSHFGTCLNQALSVNG